MIWEIEDCLIRLENQMYGSGKDHTALSDRHMVEDYICELEKELTHLKLEMARSSNKVPIDVIFAKNIGGCDV